MTLCTCAQPGSHQSGPRPVSSLPSQSSSLKTSDHGPLRRPWGFSPEARRGSQGENPVLQQHFRNMEALALDLMEPEQAVDLTRIQQHHSSPGVHLHQRQDIPISSLLAPLHPPFSTSASIPALHIGSSVPFSYDGEFRLPLVLAQEVQSSIQLVRESWGLLSSHFREHARVGPWYEGSDSVSEQRETEDTSQ